MRRHHSAVLLAALLGQSLIAQNTEQVVTRTRETVVLPVLNFNTDEGFGYGALLEMYDYGGGARPYRWTLQPTVLLTTKGRRDVTLFFDAPNIRGTPWRVDAYVGREQELAAPYYGLGNDAVEDEQLEQEPNVYYYRYGRERVRLMANVQRQMNAKVRLLAGVGYANVKTDATPFDSGTTLFSQQFGSEPRGSHLSARAGVVLDTRDREIGPHNGWWNDLLVQTVSGANGASGYTRVTATLRRYTPITARLTGASRLIVQNASGDVPIYDLATVQSSYKSDEGLGGSHMLRGIPKNRVMGKGLFLLNDEVRWHAADFHLAKRPMFLVLNGFFDTGRVWTESLQADELLSDLWTGYGAGARLGLGQSSVVALDVGHSSSATQIYIGLGYAY